MDGGSVRSIVTIGCEILLFVVMLDEEMVDSGVH